MIKYIKLFMKQYKLVKKIEKALGFKLYPWQIEYIFTGSQDSRPTGRKTGATTAYIIRMLLDKATPLYIPTSCNSYNFNFATDRPDDRMYTEWMSRETFEIFNKLISAGTSVRYVVTRWNDLKEEAVRNIFVTECKYERSIYEGKNNEKDRRR